MIGKRFWMTLALLGCGAAAPARAIGCSPWQTRVEGGVRLGVLRVGHLDASIIDPDDRGG